MKPQSRARRRKEGDQRLSSYWQRSCLQADSVKPSGVSSSCGGGSSRTAVLCGNGSKAFAICSSSTYPLFLLSEIDMIHEALRLIRVYHDMSQTELCVELGISNSFLSEIESGKKQPTLDLLNRYSANFDIPVSSLLFFSENLNSGVTNGIRLGAAKKVISLLQWVEAKGARKAAHS